MEAKIESICVFESSSNDIDKIYFQSAYELGVEIAKNHFNIVYGASNLGLMGEVTNAARMHGSEIIGVMPEKLYNIGIKPGDCTKFILTKGMRERKAKMDELSQAVIALCGGFGTLEELSEMIVQKQLGYNNKPIVILNTNGYYNSLNEFFQNAIKEKFAPEISQKLYHITSSPKDALDYIKNYEYQKNDFLGEKLHSK